jgi:uncharacterized protein YqgC (DUF456 family)
MWSVFYETASMLSGCCYVKRVGAESRNGYGSVIGCNLGNGKTEK